MLELTGVFWIFHSLTIIKSLVSFFPSKDSFTTILLFSANILSNHLRNPFDLSSRFLLFVELQKLTPFLISNADH